jgi:hypothetical protein
MVSERVGRIFVILYPQFLDEAVKKRNTVDEKILKADNAQFKTEALGQSF